MPIYRMQIYEKTTPVTSALAWMVIDDADAAT